MWQLFYSKEGIIILIITEGTISTITTKRDLDCWQMRQLNWKKEDEDGRC